MHDPLTLPSPATPATPEDPELLLLWAARVRESGLHALAEAASLTRALEHRALHGVAGDALAELGAAVALGVCAAGRSALEAADQLTRSAQRAQHALDAVAAAAAAAATADAAAASATDRTAGR